MTGEAFVALWRDCKALREAVIAHAKSLTKDTDLQQDLVQEAWIAICQFERADMSEALYSEAARKAQDSWYRQQVPAPRKYRGNRMLAVRLDDEHWHWVMRCESKLKWPRSSVMRLIVEYGAKAILGES